MKHLLRLDGLFGYLFFSKDKLVFLFTFKGFFSSPPACSDKDRVMHFASCCIQSLAEDPWK